MASMNAVTSMPFACDNGGCNKRFRPLVPRLSLSPSSTPVANAVWSQQCHDQYVSNPQQVFSSTSAISNLSMSAAACFLERKFNKLDGEAEATMKERDNNGDRFIAGSQQLQKTNMKDEVESCAQSHPSGTRWNPTPEQIRILEMFYKGGMRTPNAEQIEHITAQLRQYGKIEGKNVFYWFQNHKARERQKQKRNSLAASTAPSTNKRVSSSDDNTNNTDACINLQKPNNNGAYGFFNLPFAAATSETSWPTFNSSSSLLSMQFSKGLASLGLDLRTPPPPSSGAKRDPELKSFQPFNCDLGGGISPSKKSNTMWDSFNNGDGGMMNMAIPHDFKDKNEVIPNSCKRKNRMWQIGANEDLSLHTESSSESICLQTSHPIDSNHVVEEEDRKLQTLELFPLSPEGSLKSKTTPLMDLLSSSSNRSAESSSTVVHSSLLEFLIPKHSDYSI